MTQLTFIQRARNAGHDCPDDAALSTEADMRCQKCGQLWPIGLIDAKHSKNGDFERFECPECYGPNWNYM